MTIQVSQRPARACSPLPRQVVWRAGGYAGFRIRTCTLARHCTLSTWLTPTWNGIDNDAEISIEIDNLGEKTYLYRDGQDIFDFESNFRIFSEKENFSIVDSSRGGITLNNKRVYIENEEEKEN